MLFLLGQGCKPLITLTLYMALRHCLNLTQVIIFLTKSLHHKFPYYLQRAKLNMTKLPFAKVLILSSNSFLI